VARSVDHWGMCGAHCVNYWRVRAEMHAARSVWCRGAGMGMALRVLGEAMVHRCVWEVEDPDGRDRAAAAGDDVAAVAAAAAAAGSHYSALLLVVVLLLLLSYSVLDHRLLTKHFGICLSRPQLLLLLLLLLLSFRVPHHGRSAFLRDHRLLRKHFGLHPSHSLLLLLLLLSHFGPCHYQSHSLLLLLQLLSQFGPCHYQSRSPLPLPLLLQAPLPLLRPYS